MKTHGDAGWESFPTYLDMVVPRFLEILGSATSGSRSSSSGRTPRWNETARRSPRSPTPATRSATTRSTTSPGCTSTARREIEDEIARAEEAIEEATGRAPTGSGGPGYSASRRTMLEVLAAPRLRLRRLDPPDLHRAARPAYYFMTSKLTAEEKDERKMLFGGMRDGLRPLQPYRWQLGERQLHRAPRDDDAAGPGPVPLQLPPLPRGLQRRARCAYFRLCAAACRIRGMEPSLLLHPLDFLGGDDVADSLLPRHDRDGGGEAQPDGALAFHDVRDLRRRSDGRACGAWAMHGCPRGGRTSPGTPARPSSWRSMGRHADKRPSVRGAAGFRGRPPHDKRVTEIAEFDPFGRLGPPRRAVSDPPDQSGCAASDVVEYEDTASGFERRRASCSAISSPPRG